MKKLIRLLVALTIKHDEEYYKNALISLGVDISKLEHNQIALFVSNMKMIEADILIDCAFKSSLYNVKDINIDFLKHHETNI